MNYSDWLKIVESSEKIDSMISVLSAYTEHTLDRETTVEYMNHISVMLSHLKKDTFSLREDIKKITVTK